jgi:hypothetical protein
LTIRNLPEPGCTFNSDRPRPNSPPDARKSAVKGVEKVQLRFPAPVWCPLAQPRISLRPPSSLDIGFGRAVFVDGRKLGLLRNVRPPPSILRPPSSLDIGFGRAIFVDGRKLGLPRSVRPPPSILRPPSFLEIGFGRAVFVSLPKWLRPRDLRRREIQDFGFENLEYRFLESDSSDGLRNAEAERRVPAFAPSARSQPVRGHVRSDARAAARRQCAHFALYMICASFSEIANQHLKPNPKRT